jgi:hypothetical protein
LILHRITIATALCAMFSPPLARAETLTICTAVADAASGKTLKQEGACDTRATSASTFKIAISLMGFDAGFLAQALRHATLCLVTGFRQPTVCNPFSDTSLSRVLARVR